MSMIDEAKLKRDAAQFSAEISKLERDIAALQQKVAVKRALLDYTRKLLAGPADGRSADKLTTVSTAIPASGIPSPDKRKPESAASRSLEVLQRERRPMKTEQIIDALGEEISTVTKNRYRTALFHLAKSGAIKRVGSGLFELPNAPDTEGV